MASERVWDAEAAGDLREKSGDRRQESGDQEIYEYCWIFWI